MLALLSKFFRKNLRKKHRGETLVEILAAVFVLAITATATTSLIVNSSRTSYNIRRTFQARYLAREAFDMLRMIRDTNWIRFSDKNCWNIKFDSKTCSKQNPESILPGDYALVMNTAQDMYMRLAMVSNAEGNPFEDCKNSSGPLQNPYKIYENKTDNPDNAYNGVMFGTDGVPPADNTPAFCRRIKLKQADANRIKVDVTIAWKVGSQENEETYSSYLMNY